MEPWRDLAGRQGFQALRRYAAPGTNPSLFTSDNLAKARLAGRQGFQALRRYAAPGTNPSLFTSDNLARLGWLGGRDSRRCAATPSLFTSDNLAKARLAGRQGFKALRRYAAPGTNPSLFRNLAKARWEAGIPGAAPLRGSQTISPSLGGRVQALRLCYAARIPASQTISPRLGWLGGRDSRRCAATRLRARIPRCSPQTISPRLGWLGGRDSGRYAARAASGTNPFAVQDSP